MTRSSKSSQSSVPAPIHPSNPDLDTATSSPIVPVLRTPTLPGVRAALPPVASEGGTERPEGPSRTDPPPGEGTGVTGAANAPGGYSCPRCNGPLVCYPPDSWKERFRTLRDGAVYLAVTWVCYRLKMSEKLDVSTAVFFLLLAGIRFRDITEILALRAGVLPRSTPGS